MCRRFLSRSATPLTTLLVALAVGLAGSAHAQTANNCSNYANASKGAFCINGSDTWFDVMTKAIKNKVTEDKGAGCPSGPGCVAPHILQIAGEPAPGESVLFYNGTGSGNAANSMKFGAPGGGGPITGLGTQSIGPMSRNFRPNESCSPGNPNCTPSVTGQFPLWQPQIPNVGGLDAAVIVTRSQANRFTNFDLALVPTDSTKANPNNTGLACTFGSPGGGANCYDQLLQVILSGVDGSGSTAACASPKRVQAIADFSGAFGTTLRHFYRRDDNSGTTDTFKDKINVARFCNGAAVGVLGTNKVHPNLNNQDLDPIRRPCDPPVAGVKEQVACTDLSTGLQCSTNTANCSQGFLTAISENDPGITDFTVTIASRSGSDASGLTVGYAGREAIRLPSGTTAGPFINTNPPSDALVRLDTYLLARRLFLQRGPAIPALDVSANEASTIVRANTGVCAGPGPCRERVTNNGGTNTGLRCPDGDANTCTGGGTRQRNAEDAFFAWATDTGGGGSQNGIPGRCNLDPIIKEFGFLTCTDDCTSPPSGSSNLCSKTPYPTVPSTPAACFPTSGTWTYNQRTTTVTVGATGTPAAPVCCSTNAAAALSGGTCSNNPATACTTNVQCGGGTSTCNFTATCPAAVNRAVNSACSGPDGTQAECTTGTTCTDIGGGLFACQ